jgi:DNA-directed RNA polymerase specialized sigma24 family protein
VQVDSYDVASYPNMKEKPVEKNFEVPKDNRELYSRYRDFVNKLVRRYDSVGRHQEDLEQAVWLRLLEADIINKFRESLGRGLPEFVNGEQAASLLGISFEQWRVSQWRARTGRCQWAPTPVRGTGVEKRAVFRRADVEAVAHHFKRRRPGGEAPAPTTVLTPVSKGRFESYLTVAVHNAYKNFCRTVSRKDRDLYLPPGEDGDSWESNVPSGGASPDICAELRLVISRMGSTATDVVDLL